MWMLLLLLLLLLNRMRLMVLKRKRTVLALHQTRQIIALRVIAAQIMFAVTNLFASTVH
jgi:hypothetical protein